MVASAVAAVAVVVGGYSAKKASDAQKDATREAKKGRLAQQAADQIKTQQAQRQQLREARIKAAVATQSAENQGASGSSAASGGAGGIRTQGYANVGTLGQLQDLSNQATGFFNKSADASSKAGGYSAASGFAFSIAGYAADKSTIFD